ncbi:hypothetical protein EUZ85_19180 [Hahella sp. KA22]|uniref:hypothetical protein n=1 Tax=Hahella sp. KA22 TaxID=1628392 RepID=UPI000FDE937E|nr:hypothetical protein [Hahella sp. KA22]AZZ92730.1 hypothetical protein ENC22_16600 [Hahella sp. KA22]QAY56104.1 hypothetical protein EUZ85_19180 [Hahella sp. KA22]
MVRKALLILSVLTMITGCNTEMKPIDKQSLEAKLEDSINNSAESWWYAGTKDGKHVIAIKRPMSEELFAIDSQSLEITIPEFAFTSDEGSWVNIKATDFKF